MTSDPAPIKGIAQIVLLISCTKTMKVALFLALLALGYAAVAPNTPDDPKLPTSDETVMNVETVPENIETVPEGLAPEPMPPMVPAFVWMVKAVEVEENELKRESIFFFSFL